MYKNGNARSATLLGTIFYKGEFGIAKDFVKALPYLEKASKEYNDSIAQGALSTMYLKGDGVEKNWMQAYLFASLAVENDDETSSMFSANLALLEGIEKVLTEEQITKAKEYVQLHKEKEDTDKQIEDMFEDMFN